jgi:glycosyltransferase involved in cell wall biosynthesis
VIVAAAEVRRRTKDPLLLIAGVGPLAIDLQARISAAGLEETVRLLGFISDSVLPLAYRASDITLVPSIALEGFGLIVVESLAAGTPVLVTPVGGLPETIEHLSPQCVLPTTGPRAVTEGLVAAISGTLKLPTYEECTSYARQCYHWPVIAPRVSAVYAEAMQ